MANGSEKKTPINNGSSSVKIVPPYKEKNCQFLGPPASDRYNSHTKTARTRVFFIHKNEVVRFDKERGKVPNRWMGPSSVVTSYLSQIHCQTDGLPYNWDKFATRSHSKSSTITPHFGRRRRRRRLWRVSSWEFLQPSAKYCLCDSFPLDIFHFLPLWLVRFVGLVVICWWFCVSLYLSVYLYRVSGNLFRGGADYSPADCFTFLLRLTWSASTSK